MQLSLQTHVIVKLYQAWWTLDIKRIFWKPIIILYININSNVPGYYKTGTYGDQLAQNATPSSEIA